jgi:hypothetical protein
VHILAGGVCRFETRNFAKAQHTGQLASHKFRRSVFFERQFVVNPETLQEVRKARQAETLYKRQGFFIGQHVIDNVRPRNMRQGIRGTIGAEM